MSIDEIITQRELVEKEARTWLHTPFHHEARVKHAGVDCAQFLAGVLEAVFNIKIVFPEFPGYAVGHYPSQWFLHDLQNPAKADFYLRAFQQNDYFIELSKELVEKGDLVLSVIGRTYCHGGLITNWPKVIQAESAPLGRNEVAEIDANSNWFLRGREMKFFSWKAWHV